MFILLQSDTLIVNHNETQEKQTVTDPRLAVLQASAAELKHAIKNPLAIVSGNAQLLLELAKFKELGPDIVDPIRDIEEASRRISLLVDKLAQFEDRDEQTPW